MTRYKFDDGYTCTIRVWRSEDELKSYYNKKDLTEFVEEAYRKYQHRIDKLVKEIGEFERVNAVEVVDSDSGEGIVYYKNWP